MFTKFIKTIIQCLSVILIISSLTGCKDPETPKIAEVSKIPFTSPDQVVGTWKIIKATSEPTFIGLKVNFTESGEVTSSKNNRNPINGFTANNKVTWKHLNRKTGGTLIWTESKIIAGEKIPTRFDTFQRIYALKIEGNTMSWYPFHQLPVNKATPSDTADFIFTRVETTSTALPTDH